jgi:hypothetical protein
VRPAWVIAWKYLELEILETGGFPGTGWTVCGCGHGAAVANSFVQLKWPCHCATTMFVRFRHRGRHRLEASIVETARRADGKVCQKHVAGLGSILMPASVADRVAFWQQAHERLANLSNRIDQETRGKLMGSLHEKIPMPTADEQQALQLENAALAVLKAPSAATSVSASFALVVSPGSPNVEAVPAMLPNLEAAERDEKCVWCGRPREDHEESREPGADVPRVPCLGLRKYYKWF